MNFVISTSDRSSSFLVFDENMVVVESVEGISSEDIPVRISNFATLISKIFVDVGPGSFTGIRAGISFASGLAWGLSVSNKDCKVVPLSSFDIMQLWAINKELNFKTFAFAIPSKSSQFYVRLVDKNCGSMKDVVLSDLELNLFDNVFYKSDVQFCSVVYDSFASLSGGIFDQSKIDDIDHACLQKLLNELDVRETNIEPQYCALPSCFNSGNVL